MNFKLGDIVGFGGLICEVTGTSNFNGRTEYPIEVRPRKSASHKWHFTVDGKLSDLHTEPLLTLISRDETVEVKKSDLISALEKICTIGFDKEHELLELLGYNKYKED